MTTEEMLERMAKAAFLADRPIDYNEAYTEVDASYFEMLVQAALRELAVLVDNESKYLTVDNYWAAVGDAVKEITELEL